MSLHIYMFIYFNNEYIWQSSLQQSGWRKDGYKSPFVEFFQNSWRDEALQPSPRFWVVPGAIYVFVWSEKEAITFHSTTSAKSQMWWLYNRSSIFALVLEEFPHCFCCFCRWVELQAFRHPEKKSAKQCWAYLSQIEWGTSNDFWGMRFTYPGQHDWGNFSEGSVGLGIFRSSMIQDLHEDHHQNIYISIILSWIMNVRSQMCFKIVVTWHQTVISGCLRSFFW